MRLEFSPASTVALMLITLSMRNLRRSGRCWSLYNSYVKDSNAVLAEGVHGSLLHSKRWCLLGSVVSQHGHLPLWRLPRFRYWGNKPYASLTNDIRWYAFLRGSPLGPVAVWFLVGYV